MGQLNNEELPIEGIYARRAIREKIGNYVREVRRRHGILQDIYETLGIGRADGVLFENGLKPLEDLPEGFIDRLGEALGAQKNLKN